jgi:hypothetical protein
MENLNLAATNVTPAVYFDATQHQFTFRGASFPENPKSFYKPLLDWLTKYFAHLPDDCEVVFTFEFAYFNSGSSRMLSELFELLNQQAFEQATPIDVYWKYDAEDDNMFEYGQELQTEYRALVLHLLEM